MELHLLYPTIANALYCFVLPGLAVTILPHDGARKRNCIFWISLVHNGLLTAFSVWSFVSLSRVIYQEGIVFRAGYYFRNPVFDRIIYTFYLSKYYEFGDTFLIYAKDKKPLLLQTYHHTGAVVIWHLMYVYKVDGIWIATLLNSFVHSVMYSYYFGTVLKINGIFFLKKYITTLQLIQFFILYIKWYVYRPPIESLFNYGIINLFALYGFGVIYLFGRFYHKQYIIKNK